MQVLDGAGNADGQVDASSDPGAGGADLTVARHEAVVDCHARGALGGAKGDCGLVEQVPILHPIAAGEDELRFGHGDLRRVHGHRAEILDARQAVGDLLAQLQRPGFVPGFADGLGAFGCGQNQPRQCALNILLATACAADDLLAGDLPDAGGRTFTQLGSQATAQLATAGAAVGQ